MHLHLSIIIQIDGLLYECCCLRLERDMCVTSSSMSLCNVLGVGISPALSLYGLSMPAPSMLRAVIKHYPDSKSTC